MSRWPMILKYTKFNFEALINLEKTMKICFIISLTTM